MSRAQARQGVVLVTGGARGIGQAIAGALAEDDWTVVCGDVALGSFERAEPGYAIGLDVTDEASVDAVYTTVAAELGPIDAIVNNAGVTRDRTLRKMTSTEWRGVLSVNLDGAFLMTRAFARTVHDRDATFGRVVNISSISGKVGNFGQANYAASKAGLVALTKVTARELAGHGVTANAVMPGLIRTTMTEAMPEEVLADRIQGIPLGRLGSMDEVAEAVRWLCSPHAGYVTGSVLEVAGGRAM